MAQRGRVLIIDGEEWGARVLSKALTDAKWQVDVVGEARAGFSKACALLPDCVLCALDLPDIDGFYVVRRLRTEAGMVARIPIILFGDLPDSQARVQGLNVGADVVLGRPITNEEVVAQVDALVTMSKRLRGEIENASAATQGAAIRGDMSLFPLASFLMMLEMERRTGTLDVKAGSGTRAVLTIVHGLFADTVVDGEPKPPIEVLRDVLAWRAGSFSFRPRDVASMPPPRASVGAVVLEAMRLEDEKKAMP